MDAGPIWSMAFVKDESEASVPPDELSCLLGAIARDRDREAFATLFTRLAPRLKSFLMQGGLAASVAEDLVQETMLAVWRKAQSFDPDRGNAAAWIFTIARNLRIDHIRRRHRVAPREIDPAHLPEPVPWADAAMMADERELRLRAALTTLTEDQATVLRLSFFSEVPHADISRELGIPLGTVKSRVRLAMAKLRALLDDMP